MTMLFLGVNDEQRHGGASVLHTVHISVSWTNGDPPVNSAVDAAIVSQLEKYIEELKTGKRSPNGIVFTSAQVDK